MAARASRRTLIATSVTDWPGWIAEESGRRLELETVNHAFLGVWVAPGDHTIRLAYRPASWPLGLAAFALGCGALFVLALAGRRESLS